MVIGASLSLRTKERLLQVWLKDGRNQKLRDNVSNKIRHFLSLDPTQVTLYYKEHIKSIKDGSTMKNAEGFKFMTNGGTKPDQAKPWSSLGTGAQNPTREAGQSFQSSGNGSHQGGKFKHQQKPFEKLGASEPKFVYR
jgi:hypothetical protein